MIKVRSVDVKEKEAVAYDHSDVLPFLKTIEFYEKRLLNRPEVMKAIKDRVLEIIDEKPKIESAEPY